MKTPALHGGSLRYRRGEEYRAAHGARRNLDGYTAEGRDCESDGSKIQLQVFVRKDAHGLVDEIS